MLSSGPPNVDLLREFYEQILEDYAGRLRNVKSALFGTEADRARLEVLARLVLKNVVRDVCSLQPPPERRRDEFQQSARDAGIRGGLHPCESLRVGALLAEAAISVLVGKLPPSATKEEVVGLSLVVERSIAEYMTAAGALYVDQLLHALRETEFEERRRVSREMHDRVAQSLTVTCRELELYDLLKDSDASCAEAKVKTAREAAGEAVTHVRELCTELRSMEAEEGLEVAISEFLRARVAPDVRCWVDARGDDAHVEPHSRDQVFMIVREAIINAIKHSGARTIKVDLLISPSDIRVSVSDDGGGFDPLAAELGRGIGLSSMRERTAILGGSLELASSAGVGTTASLHVPRYTFATSFSAQAGR